MLLVGMIVGILLAICLPVIVVCFGVFGAVVAFLWPLAKWVLVGASPIIVIAILVGYMCGRNAKKGEEE